MKFCGMFFNHSEKKNCFNQNILLTLSKALMYSRCICIHPDKIKDQIPFGEKDHNGIKPLKVSSSPSLNHQISLHVHFEERKICLTPKYYVLWKSQYLIAPIKGEKRYKII